MMPYPQERPWTPPWNVSLLRITVATATNLPVDSTWWVDWDHKSLRLPRGYRFALVVFLKVS